MPAAERHPRERPASRRARDFSGQLITRSVASELAEGVVEVEPEVLLENSILFPGSLVPRGTTLRSCIVAGVHIDSGVYLETDFV